MEWKISTEPIDYLDAMDFMESRVQVIIEGKKDNLVWLLEHNSVYTAGTSADNNDLITPDKFPVHQTGRGGEYTYHGIGQRIAYVMIDLRKQYEGKPDLKKYVYDLEQWIILTLQHFGIKGERQKNRIGIWIIDDNGNENKIAALGIRVRKWVAFHGIAININPDLEHFNGIVPCGIKNYGVTSLEKRGIETSMNEVNAVLKRKFGEVFTI